MNNGSAETGERGRTLRERRPGGEGFEAWKQKGSKARLGGGSREYKAHELTTITGCVMMGMGGEQRQRKPNLNELHML